MKSTVTEIARDTYRISTFHPDFKGLSGPMANDLPYTPYTDATLRRLAAPQPRTLAMMHGSTFRGDGGKAILDLARGLKETLGTRA